MELLFLVSPTIPRDENHHHGGKERENAHDQACHKFLVNDRAEMAGELVVVDVVEREIADPGRYCAVQAIVLDKERLELGSLQRVWNSPRRLVEEHQAQVSLCRAQSLE